MPIAADRGVESGNAGLEVLIMSFKSYILPFSAGILGVSLCLVPSLQAQEATGDTQVGTTDKKVEELNQAETQGLTLRLKSGKFLVAELLEAGEDGIRVRRLDNGGEISLRWDDLMADDVERIKAQNSLLGNLDASEVMIRAVRAEYRSKTGSRQTVEGEMVESTKDRLVLQKKGNRFTIPRARLLGAPQEVELPITDILRKDEIYQRKFEEIAPGEDADKHVLLAAYLIRVDLLDKAKEHLDKAQELGGGDQPKKVEGMLSRVDSLIANKEQADLLAEITIAKNRKQFKKALALCDRFEKEFPGSPLTQEFESRKATVLAARETYFVKRVTLDWYEQMWKIADKLAGNSKLSFEEAQSLAESEFGKQVRESIAKKRELPVQEVERFFGEREERKVWRPRKVTYGNGSWLLGSRQILKDTKQGAAQEAKKGKTSQGQGQKSEEFKKRLREFLRKTRGQGQGNQPQKNLDTPAAWWKKATRAVRRQWLVAYYADKGGDLDVTYAGLEPCPTCSGRGFLEVQDSTTGKVIRQTCPTCHRERFQRFIRYH